MAEPILSQDVHYWESQLAEAEENVRIAALRRDALRRIVDGAHILRSLENEQPAVEVRDEDVGTATEAGIVTSNGRKTLADLYGPLRGRDAIRAVLGHAGSEMEQREVYSEMKRLGWIEPDLKDGFASVRVTMRRMWKKGELEKMRDGVYRIASPNLAVGTLLDDVGDRKG
jgi:hypothetical protein